MGREEGRREWGRRWEVGEGGERGEERRQRGGREGDRRREEGGREGENSKQTLR
jgi:hypothetical protein